MATLLPIAYPGMRVGLFGGSFNPPHQGHRHAALLALARLGLDQVWWLVAPQNPLKSAHDTAPLCARLRAARAIARHPRLIVTDLETRLKTRYSADTVAAVKARYPGIRFVFIIGADNFSTLTSWDRWSSLMESIPVAVVARPGTTFAGFKGRAAQRYARARLPENRARTLVYRKPPAWVFLAGPLDPTSSTELRQAMSS